MMLKENAGEGVVKKETPVRKIKPSFFIKYKKKSQTAFDRARKTTRELPKNSNKLTVIFTCDYLLG